LAGLILLFCLAPALLVFSHNVLIRDFGPYWHGGNIDPNYAYLCNALLIANGRSPEHVDHPGTPVQLLGAVVLWSGNLGTSAAELNLRVLSDPERYLRLINRTLVALGALALFGSGVLLWRASSSLILAFGLQLASLLLIETHKAILMVAPEPLLVPIGLLFGTLFCVRLWKFGQASADVDIRVGWLMSLLAGLAVATKITFAPIAAIPLLFASTVRQALITGLVLFGAFLVGIAPALGRLGRMGTWLFNLATHSGLYGRGAIGPISVDTYADNIVELSGYLGILPVVWTLVLVIVLISSRLGPLLKRRCSILYGVILIQILTLMLVARQPAARYLLPVFTFAPFLGGAALMLVFAWPSRSRIFGLSACGAVLILGGWIFRHDWSAFKQELQARAEDVQLCRAWLQENKGDQRIIYYYGGPSPEYALHFGNLFSLRAFAEIMQADHTSPIFYGLFNGKFDTFGGTIPLSSVYASRVPFLMVGQGGIDGTALSGREFPLIQGWTKRLVVNQRSVMVHLLSAAEGNNGSPPQTKNCLVTPKK
jgi:hypothetical protein